MNEQFSLRTVRKKIMLISKTAGIALMVSYLISIRLPLEEEVSFLLWVIFVVLLIKENLEHSYEGWKIVKELTGHSALKDI